MEKVTLNYDENQGCIYDGSGSIVGTFYGLQSIEADDERLSVDKICKLKEAGFDHEAIIAMHKAKVV